MRRRSVFTTVRVVLASTLLPLSIGAQGIEFVTEDGLAKDAQGYADNMGVPPG